MGGGGHTHVHTYAMCVQDMCPPGRLPYLAEAASLQAVKVVEGLEQGPLQGRPPRPPQCLPAAACGHTCHELVRAQPLLSLALTGDPSTPSGSQHPHRGPGVLIGVLGG